MFVFRQQVTSIEGIAREVKGSQLPKMQKYIPDMPLSSNLDFRSRWSVSVQLYLENFDLYEYVKFEAISLKLDILSESAELNS